MLINSAPHIASSEGVLTSKSSNSRVDNAHWSIQIAKEIEIMNYTTARLSRILHKSKEAMHKYIFVENIMDNEHSLRG